MPLTPEGRKVLRSYKKEYGDKKGEEVFYASINKGNPGSEKWHNKKENPSYNKSVSEMSK